MPTAMDQVPAELVDLLTGSTLGHVTVVTPKGNLISHIMWVDYEDGRVMTSSRVGSAKGKALRADPRVSISVVDTANPWRWVSVSGRVVEILPDTDLVFIDKMSRRYTGRDYVMRDMAREVFVIAPERVRSSTGR
ncbi:MAG TPA: pyridoxamine 5'-phosphate oxidase family protein [Methylomirabilota bacterium]|jgi:PPOX class probable F420-dependent enzyme|nr:pyridoxamine 5'-phosphate oxidase family protein [Methylomirabilota bacterium]